MNVNVDYLKESFFDKVIYFFTLSIIKILRVLLGIFGSRIELRNTIRHAKEKRPVILACTHENGCDIPLSALIPKKKLRYIAKKELFKEKGFVNWWLNRVKAIPLDRDKPSIITIKCAIQTLKNGHWLVVFPEGTRVIEKKFEEIESGVASIALLCKDKNKPLIVPVAIVYSIKRSIIGFPRHVIIECGDPIDTENFSDKKALTTELANRMKVLYQSSIDHL
jgi:1-acyl-sn-glycerol-3-phosphate acyltransferase